MKEKKNNRKMSKKYKIVFHNKKCQKWITNCWIFSIFFLDVLKKNWIKANVLPDDNGKLFFIYYSHVWGIHI